MLILMQFLGFGAKNQGGGLTLKGQIAEPAHFVFQSCLIVPSIWQSFIQIGEIACITPAWSSGKLGLQSSETLKQYLDHYFAQRGLSFYFQ